MLNRYGWRTGSPPQCGDIVGVEAIVDVARCPWLSRHCSVQWCCLLIIRYRSIYISMAAASFEGKKFGELQYPWPVPGGVEFELFFGSSCYRDRPELWLAWPVHFFSLLFFHYLDLIWLGRIFSPFLPNRGRQLLVFFTPKEKIIKTEKIRLKK